MNLLKNIFFSLLAVAFLATACGDEDDKPENNNTEPPALNDLLDGEFPIVAWTGIDAADSEVKFPAMKEVGCNIYLGWYRNLAEATSVLKSAENAGVKVILSCPELFSQTEQTLNEMKSFSSLYGYHIDDEPEVGDFGSLGAQVKKIQSFDKEHPCYINLYPNWAWGGPAGYTTKVEAFLKQVPVPFLSFDYYPIMETNGVSSLRPDWYKNLEDIATASKAHGIPFWAFALALSHSIPDAYYPIPTVGELRLQVFSNLAYGAQGIQYFTYWGIYHDKPTNVYERVKIVNKDVQNLAHIFLRAQVLSVWHTGAQLPNGTRPVDQLPGPIKSLDTSDGGAVVSYMEKGDNQYLMVVNRDYQKQMVLTVSVDSSVQQVRKDGSVTKAVSGSQIVDMGDMVLFTWKK